ncbi:MAG: YncE family protein [Planctomycetota bacterium]|jgi:hypothetical protein
MTEQFQYGFRVDPMEFVERGDSLQAAVVRTLVFDASKPNDEAVIEAHFAEVFATQNDDGSFKDEDEPDRMPLAATSARLRDLLIDGCSPDRPEVQRAIAFVEKALDELPEADWPQAPLPAVRAMCLLGKGNHPAIKVRLEALAEEVHGLLGAGCPGTPFAQLINLWAGRDVADVEAAIEAALAWVERAAEPTGCSRDLGLCDPWSIIEALAQIDHPAATRAARTLVPMLLRNQNPDGTFGEESNTFWALILFQRHGLLEELRKLPPLPADWRVVRAIPAPDGKTFEMSNMAFDGGRLWVYDGSTSSAIAVSPEDGAVLHRTKLPRGTWCTAFGAWDGFLWALTGERKAPKTLHKIDPGTGDILQEIVLGAFLVRHFSAMIKVGNRVVIPDQWEGCVWVFDPADPDKYQEVRLAAGMPDFLTGAGETIWANDSWAGALILTNLDGELLEWGERPFGSLCPVAWDGRNLWALDNVNRRICIIEKAEAKQWAPAAPPRYVRDWLILGPLPSDLLPGEQQRRAGHDTDYLQAVGGEATALPTEGEAVPGADVTWQQVTFEEDSIMFAQLFGEGSADGHVVYAYTTVDSPQACEAYLAMGIAGSLKVYLNGQLVHNEHLARFAPRESLLIPVHFRSGENHVLVKVDNDIGDGGFILRAVTLDPTTLERLPLPTAVPVGSQE